MPNKYEIDEFRRLKMLIRQVASEMDEAGRRRDHAREHFLDGILADYQRQMMWLVGPYLRRQGFSDDDIVEWVGDLSSSDFGFPGFQMERE